MYDAKAIANYFLQLAKRDHKDLDPMKIQKLVYFANGWYLALQRTPLLRDMVEAWPYGPVIPSLYESFKRYGNSPITEPATSTTWSGGKVTPRIDDDPDRQKNQFAKALIEAVWELYRDYSGVQLSRITHEPGSPWFQTWSANPGRTGKDIDDGLMMEYFEKDLGVAPDATAA